jgi:hypothetical protein
MRKEANPIRPEVKAHQERFMKTPYERAELKALKHEHKKYLKAKTKEPYER